MHYSIESRERRYVKGYGLLSFAKKMGTHATRVAKNLNNKYGQKLADTAKKIFNRCIKNCKQKSNLKNSSSNWRFSNLIANKITSISKKKPASESHSNAASNEIPKERYISTRKTKN